MIAIRRIADVGGAVQGFVLRTGEEIRMAVDEVVNLESSLAEGVVADYPEFLELVEGE